MGNGAVQVDTMQLRAAAAKVDDAAVKVWNAVVQLRNSLNAKGFPFGHDNYGKKFTEGDKGYTTSSGNLVSGAENMTRSLNHFSAGMKDAATKMDTMDARTP
jgi:hypothetical protein